MSKFNLVGAELAARCQAERARERDARLLLALLLNPPQLNNDR